MSQSLEANNIKSKDGTELISTILINPQNWNASKLRIDVSEETLDLRPSECEKTSLEILSDFSGMAYGYRGSELINRYSRTTFFHNFNFQLSDMSFFYFLFRCCNESCESKQIESENGIMLAIFRSSDLTDGSYFMIDWKTGKLQIFYGKLWLVHLLNVNILNLINRYKQSTCRIRYILVTTYFRNAKQQNINSQVMNVLCLLYTL